VANGNKLKIYNCSLEYRAWYRKNMRALLPDPHWERRGRGKNMLGITIFAEHLGGFSAKPQRYWSFKNMRELLETYAKQRGLDPLVSETWYSIGESDIRGLKVLKYVN
jgi:hypothetical protein